MSAYGTKKMGGDFAVQLTYPAVFSANYDRPLAYFPSTFGYHAGSAPMIGHDFQSDYHEQKRLDANQSVHNGLRARHTAECLLLTGHQNYHLPKPVLTQRVFANPMYGYDAPYSSRWDTGRAPYTMTDTAMRGGVLRTEEGQAWGRELLRKRIAQLNRIDTLESGKAVPAGQRAPVDRSDLVGDSSKVEFNLLRQTLIDSLSTGEVSRFSFGDAVRMLLLLFRYAPQAGEDEMEDLVAGFDTIVELTRGLLELPPDQTDALDVSFDFLESLSILMEKARQYVAQMNGAVYRTDKERMALSKALIRSLKFGKLLRLPANRLVREVARVEPRVAQAYENNDGDDVGFYRQATPREDAEQRGMARQPLAGVGWDRNQSRFGVRSGAFTAEGREATTYFGEDVAQTAEVPMVLPINAAAKGETAAEAEDLVEAEEKVREAVLEVLSELGYEDGTGVSISAFAEQQYPDTEDFFTEVERKATEKGLSKAAIAKGMEEMGEPIFTTYIAANKGTVAAPTASKTLSARDVAKQARTAAAATAATARTPASVTAVPTGFPTTRAELDANFKTTEDYRRLSQLAREAGVSFTVSPGAKLASVKKNFIYNVAPKQIYPKFPSIKYTY